MEKYDANKSITCACGCSDPSVLILYARRIEGMICSVAAAAQTAPHKPRLPIYTMKSTQEGHVTLKSGFVIANEVT